MRRRCGWWRAAQTSKLRGFVTRCLVFYRCRRPLQSTRATRTLTQTMGSHVSLLRQLHAIVVAQATHTTHAYLRGPNAEKSSAGAEVLGAADPHPDEPPKLPKPPPPAPPKPPPNEAAAGAAAAGAGAGVAAAPNGVAPNGDAAAAAAGAGAGVAAAPNGVAPNGEAAAGAGAAAAPNGVAPNGEAAAGAGAGVAAAPNGAPPNGEAAAAGAGAGVAAAPNDVAPKGEAAAAGAGAAVAPNGEGEAAAPGVDNEALNGATCAAPYLRRDTHTSQHIQREGSANQVVKQSLDALLSQSHPHCRTTLRPDCVHLKPHQRQDQTHASTSTSI